MSVVIPPRIPDGLQEIIATYGDPKPHIIDGDWIVDPQWEMRCMTTLHHDLLPHGRVYCHRLVVDALQAVLDDWKAIGGYTIKTFGCFAPRAQRGSNGFIASTHSWGIAFDINAEQNKLISPCYRGDPRRDAAGCCDIPGEWIAAARRRCWFWGGDFERRFDPMHFQLARGY
jgi:hypothetical protein